MEVNIKLLNNEVDVNAAKVFIGNVIAGLISLLALPILTRIYTPEIFGQLQFMLACVAILSVFGTLQYELAIVLPKELTRSNQVILLCVFILFSFAIICFLSSYFYGEKIISIFNVYKTQILVFAIPIITFTTVFLNISRSALIARKEFYSFSYNNVIQAGLFNFLAITIGLFEPTFFIFLLAYLISHIVSSAFAIYNKIPQIIEAYNYHSLIDIAKEYKRFPFITTTSVFVNTVSIYIPVFLFGIYYNVEILGVYMVALRFMDIPLNLLKGSITQVYFQAASEAYNRDIKELFVLYKQTVKKLFLLIIIPAIIFILIDDLVILLLGEGWEKVGHLIKIILLWKIFEFLHAPIGHTWSVIKADALAFKLRLISIVIRFLSIYLFQDDFEKAILAFSIASGAYYFTMNYFLYFLLRRNNS